MIFVLSFGCSSATLRERATPTLQTQTPPAISPPFAPMSRVTSSEDPCWKREHALSTLFQWAAPMELGRCSSEWGGSEEKAGWPSGKVRLVEPGTCILELNPHQVCLPTP
jgi:hypothetical protein